MDVARLSSRSYTVFSPSSYITYLTYRDTAESNPPKPEVNTDSLKLHGTRKRTNNEKETKSREERMHCKSYILLMPAALLACCMANEAAIRYVTLCSDL